MTMAKRMEDKRLMAFEELYNRHLDRISSNKVPVDETMKVMELLETRHFDCSARHFHDALVADRGFTRNCDRLRLKLQSIGLVQPAPLRFAGTLV